MKRLFAFALIAILLFNIGGYSMLYWLAKKQASMELQARLDRDDLPGNLVRTFKIPLTVPYLGNRGYERITGEFEHNGQFYSLVKQQLVNDTLVVVCVVNSKKKQLVDQMNRITRQGDETQSDSQPLKIANSNPIQDYANQSSIELTLASAGWAIIIPSSTGSLCPISPGMDINSPPPWC